MFPFFALNDDVCTLDEEVVCPLDEDACTFEEEDCTLDDEDVCPLDEDICTPGDEAIAILLEDGEATCTVDEEDVCMFDGDMRTLDDDIFILCNEDMLDDMLDDTTASGWADALSVIIIINNKEQITAFLMSFLLIPTTAYLFMYKLQRYNIFLYT